MTSVFNAGTDMDRMDFMDGKKEGGGEEMPKAETFVVKSRKWKIEMRLIVSGRRPFRNFLAQEFLKADFAHIMVRKEPAISKQVIDTIESGRILGRVGANRSSTPWSMA